jgi:hypothetical protein
MDEKELERCEFAVKILNKFASSKENRLKFAAAQRAKMKKDLDSGKKVDGYRFDWLNSTSDEVIKTLIAASERFNSTYYHDIVSVQDLIDILNTTIAKLTKNTKKD